MTKTKLTTDEIIEAEKAKSDRVESRKRGHAKMKERDQGWVRLSNGVLMEWSIPGGWSEEIGGISVSIGNHIPEGNFLLKMGKETKLFDAEEFRRWLRWV